MIKTSINLRELRRKIYLKAKSEKTLRFWGLYVHVCKLETLRQAYKLAKKNNGAPGVDGLTFEAIEEAGLEDFLPKIRDELVSGTYFPLQLQRVRKRHGFGWKRWSSAWFYNTLGLYSDYKIRYYQA